ncbi:hypothetical protein ACFXPR_20925 [Nocardia tengchongensis]|uniref:hypothetical protein n=1 Tax=Nocardia tengchongensis TaxID=2055889 RepID=UPI0036BC93BC
MRVTAGVFGLLFAVAGAVMMCFGYMAQHDLRDSAARGRNDLGMTCQANRDNSRMQDCTWGWWDGKQFSRGEDTLPFQERSGELVSNVVLIGGALFVGGLVLTSGALVAGGRVRPMVTAVAPSPQLQHSPAQWPGAS